MPYLGFFRQVCATICLRTPKKTIPNYTARSNKFCFLLFHFFFFGGGGRHKQTRTALIQGRMCFYFVLGSFLRGGLKQLVVEGSGSGCWVGGFGVFRGLEV